MVLFEFVFLNGDFSGEVDERTNQGFGAGAFCTGAGFCTSGAGAGCTDDRAPTPAVQLSCTDYSSVNTITKS